MIARRSNSASMRSKLMADTPCSLPTCCAATPISARMNRRSADNRADAPHYPLSGGGNPRRRPPWRERRAELGLSWTECRGRSGAFQGHACDPEPAGGARSLDVGAMERSQGLAAAASGWRAGQARGAGLTGLRPADRPAPPQIPESSASTARVISSRFAASEPTRSPSSATVRVAMSCGSTSHFPPPYST